MDLQKLENLAGLYVGSLINRSEILKIINHELDENYEFCLRSLFTSGYGFQDSDNDILDKWLSSQTTQNGIFYAIVIQKLLTEKRQDLVEAVCGCSGYGYYNLIHALQNRGIYNTKILHYCLQREYNDDGEENTLAFVNCILPNIEKYEMDKKLFQDIADKVFDNYLSEEEIEKVHLFGKKYHIEINYV